MPTNTGGGQLSAYYSTGFTGVAEAVLQLRGEAGEVSKETCQWWTGFQEAHPKQHEQGSVTPAPRKRRRRNRPRRARGGGDA